MEWTEALKRSIAYMEEHLLEDISAVDIAEALFLSPFYFQKGFSIMTGYSVGEYLRCRRLYLAGLDIIADRDKVIDLAYKYGYDNPESFTKAFRRFHGLSPMQLKSDPSRLKTFLPLTITVTIQGGNEMDYVVEKMDAFQVIGVKKMIPMENSYQEIPEFWKEFMVTYLQQRSSAATQKAVEENKIGEYGICLDIDSQGKEFPYLIAGRYQGGHIPEGMEVREIPACDWAKFKCSGPLPGALQSINSRIFKEWLPGNPNYEIAMGLNIEWYSDEDTNSADYESGIWIPVKRK